VYEEKQNAAVIDGDVSVLCVPWRSWRVAFLPCGRDSRGRIWPSVAGRHRRAREDGSGTYSTGIFPKAVQAFHRTRRRRRHRHHLPPRPATGTAVGKGHAVPGAPPSHRKCREDQRPLELARAKLHLVPLSPYPIQTFRVEQEWSAAAATAPQEV
jgi:hypothetical protein